MKYTPVTEVAGVYFFEKKCRIFPKQEEKNADN